MKSPTSSFAFATCQVGAEPALKAEVQRGSPKLRPAFMRPGFVTFKCDEPVTLEKLASLDLVFARATALSLGKADDTDVVARVLELARDGGAGSASARPRLHVWMRELHAPGDAPRAVPVDGGGGADVDGGADDVIARDPQAPATALAAKLIEAGEGAFASGVEAQAGDVVVDVVGVDPGAWYLGMHRHGPFASPFPGGDPRLAIPSDAPSKAWAKIEQGIRFADVPLREGDRVVEIGASPGGVSQALLARGCDVVAIDPGEMDPRVLASPHLRHVRAPVAEVDPASVERPVRFLVLDVNISPFAALRQIEPMVQAHAGDLYGLMLTLKLGDWHMARRVPHLLAIVEKKLGAPMAEVRAKQLPANKVEIFVAALTAAGVARRKQALATTPH